MNNKNLDGEIGGRTSGAAKRVFSRQISSATGYESFRRSRGRDGSKSFGTLRPPLERDALLPERGKCNSEFPPPPPDQ